MSEVDKEVCDRCVMDGCAKCEKCLVGQCDCWGRSDWLKNLIEADKDEDWDLPPTGRPPRSLWKKIKNYMGLE